MTVYRLLPIAGMVLLAAALLPMSIPAGASSLPGDSIMQLEATFSDQQGADFRLADRRGRVQLVSMFYTSCKYVCPLIIDSAKGVERQLDDAQRARLAVLIVSMDPARDDTAALQSVAEKRRLDPTRWTLARTDERNVRRFAALLGVRYRALVDGEFNHTSALVLVDAEGRVLARSERLGPVPDPAFVDAVRAVLDTAAADSGAATAVTEATVETSAAAVVSPATS